MSRVNSTLRAGLAALLLALLAALAPATAFAQPATSARSSARQTTASGHITVLVLDMSGSMRSNDPNGLRCSAANAYIALSGPGDYIGVVGLTGSGSGGPNGWGAASVWGNPAEMATVANRSSLTQTIAQRSHNCQPDAATPTYDALRQALAMLKTATAKSGLSGSVILLTDGAPAPDQSQQIAAIQRDLIPQFKASGFPIDSIALGADQGLHSFLSGLADATGGAYYDDGHGDVPGVSALNIAPFFVNIFAQRNGRIVSHDIPPTQLNGGTVSRNFSVGDFVSQLSVVAVKDSPGATVTLTAPNGQTVSSSTAGILFSSDPHFAIFSIPNPQQGAWQINVSGSGLFLMDSLKLSTLALSITAPTAKSPVAPLGQPLAISAVLQNGGVNVTGSRFSLTGTLTYVGGSGQYSQDFVLDDSASPGIYRAQALAPDSAPAGAYTLKVVAREISDTIASATVSLRIERFPTPLLLAPGSHTPTAAPVSTQALVWDPVLRLIYGAPLGIVRWLGQWPLQGHAAQSGVSVQGQVLLTGKPYANAHVSGTVSRTGTKSAAPLPIASPGGAAFTTSFDTPAAGTYNLTLNTQGAFQDSHGDFGTVARTVKVSLVPATLGQEGVAWAITLLYLALLTLIFLLVRYALSQRPFGMLVASDGGGGEEFARARRGFGGLLQPSVVKSQAMGMGPGMRFIFRRGGRILAQGIGADAREFRLGGEPLPAHAVPATESAITTRDGDLSYIVSVGGAGDDEEDESGGRRGVLGRRSRYGDDDEDADEAPRRRGLAGLGRRSRYSDEDEDADVRPTRRSRGRSRAAVDDDDEPRSSRGGRSRRSRYDEDDDPPARSRGRRGGRSRADDDW